METDTTKFNIVRGKVINNIDPYGGDRIQVRLGNIYDGNKSDNELPYCTPLLPKLLHVIPKNGELVLVFLEKENSGDSNRFYIGPVLSQPQRFGYDSKPSAETFLDSPDGHNNITLPHPRRNKEKNIGTLPKADDVALIGRDNTTIELTDNAINILCGYKVNGSDAPADKIMEFNTIDPAFIQLTWKERNDEYQPNKNKGKGKSYKSSITMYADRINLVSRNSDKFIGNIDGNDLITEEQMKSMLKELHPLVYGDYLIEYLQQLQTAFLTHTHPYSMLPPTNNSKNVKLGQTKFDEMISKSVKTS